MNTHRLSGFLARGELIKSLNSTTQSKKGDFKNYESDSLSSSGFVTVAGVGSLGQSAGRVELVLRCAVLDCIWLAGPTFYRMVTRTRSLRKWRSFRGRRRVARNA